MANLDWDSVEDCCECPCRHLEYQVIPSESKMIMPMVRVRIVCDSCGKKTPWCNDFETAADMWGRKKDKECK